LRHRRLGYVRESVLLFSRSRRCRRAWDWKVAPFGEESRHHRLIHRVHGYPDLAAARRSAWAA
ncbi:hypothetical protein ACFQ12_10570, partial [Methylobacterium trifolii]